ncbi:cystatin-M [Rhynchocyon petersi]
MTHRCGSYSQRMVAAVGGSQGGPLWSSPTHPCPRRGDCHDPLRSRSSPVAAPARPVSAQRVRPGGGGGGGEGRWPVKAARSRPRQMTMERTTCAMALALAAFCLLVLPPDTWARPGDLRTGERRDLSPDDPQVQRAAQAAVATYNMGSNSVYYFRDTHIIRAQSQLVSGIKYYLTMEMGSTACRKTAATGDRAVDLTICPLTTGAQQETLRCDFEILVVPWRNSSQLLKHNCVPQ